MVADIPTPEFLEQLKNTYPTSSTSQPSSYAQSITNADFVNPWFIITAIAYAASNRPKVVPFVYNYILDDLERICARVCAHIRSAYVRLEGLAAPLFFRRTRDAVQPSDMA